MSRTMIAKHDRRQSDRGFFDVEEISAEEETRDQMAAVVAGVAVRRDAIETIALLRRLLDETRDESDVYVLEKRTAADMNMAVELPAQPTYDWTDVIPADDDE